MDDLEKYISTRKKTDKKFANKFEEEYGKFKIGILLRKARKEAKITQSELANLIKTKKLLFQDYKIILKILSYLP
jgi:HTH-type transcriptional regulator / antitoxin HipB